MKEVAEAVEIEKQRHAITRREGLAKEAQFEVSYNLPCLCIKLNNAISLSPSERSISSHSTWG